MVVEGVHEGWGALDDLTDRRVIGGDDGRLVEENIGFPIVRPVTANVEHGPVRVTFLVFQNKAVEFGRLGGVVGSHHHGIAERVSSGFG